MQNECDGFVAALETWRKCENIEEDQRTYLEALIERAHSDFGAAQKAQPDEKSQKEIARRCRRAHLSIEAATERCHNGKPPKVD